MGSCSGDLFRCGDTGCTGIHEESADPDGPDPVDGSSTGFSGGVVPAHRRFVGELGVGRPSKAKKFAPELRSQIRRVTGDGEGSCESEREACGECGEKSIDT